ncbi:hypothetical protein ACHQM5_015667 [Ranunculus cassubicifolius]
MPERNLVSWTSVISGLIQNEECEMGVEVYLEMMRCGYRPNEFTLGSVLRGCATVKGVEFGWSVHCFVLKVGLVSNNFVGCSVLYMYAKFGDIEAAEMVFESMDDRDVGCWNAMIGGYARNGYSLKALELVSIMHREGAVMDQFTFMSAIKGCVSLGNYSLGRQIHGMIIRCEVAFGSPGMNSLIDMYFKIGKEHYGLRVFSQMHNKDVISWNTVLGAFAQDGNAREAICTFSSMLYKGLKPNPITISHLFNLCGALLDLYFCLQLHSVVVRLGFLDEPAVANSLIDVFSRCGLYEKAESIFGSLTVTDITTWNEMLLGYKLNGCTGEAVKLFRNLRKLPLEANESTFSIILGTCCGAKHLGIGRQIHATIIRSGFDCQSFICCSLINAYASFELFEDSFKVFSEIERLDLVSWGAMISAFVGAGRSYEALGLLNNLIEAGEKPDEFILGSILHGCANVTSYHQTKCIHSITIRTGFEKHVYVASAVIDAYAKCGDVKSSRMVFDCSSRNDDVVLYNTMIMAYAHHGIVVEALKIFEQMKLINLQPTHATFVSVISLCSHLGFVELGCQLFDSINSDYKMLPSAENYGSLVDLFSRNGLLEEAKHVLEVMPFKPWPAVWRSFLNGCRIHGNKNLGEWASEHLLELVPKNDAAFMLLAQVHSQEGSWAAAAKVGRSMLEQGIQKTPGHSWIEI